MTTLLKHTGVPNFTVYHDKNNHDFCNRLLVNLIHYKANPMFSEKPPPPAEYIQTLKGFVYLYYSDDLIKCSDYTEGNILCIQRYHQDISDFDLHINKNHSYWLYGLDNQLKCYRLGQKEYFKKQMQQAFERCKSSCFLFPPTPPQKSEESPMPLD